MYDEIYNFGRLFLGHPSFIHTSFFWCMPGVREKDFYRNNAFSSYDFYGHTPAQEPLVVMNLTVLVDPPLVIISTCIY